MPYTAELAAPLPGCGVRGADVPGTPYDHNYMYRIDNTEALNFLNNPTTGVTN